MARYVLRRAFSSLFVLWAVVTLVFFVLNVSGDPLSDELAATGATQSQIDEALARYGYDRPVYEQYWDFLRGAVVKGDLGTSIRFGDDVSNLIFERIGATLKLAVSAMIIAIAIALPLGIGAAIKKDGFLDRLGSTFANIGQSVPNFVIGPMLIMLLAVWLRILPVSGNSSTVSIILPAVTLAIAPAARISRLLRGSILEVSQSSFVRSARARGLSESRVIIFHIVRNSLLPVITLIGLQFSYMMGGAVIVETIFAWPGLGVLARNALLYHDFPLVQGIVIVVATLVITLNFITDIVYRVVDPRIKLST